MKNKLMLAFLCVSLGVSTLAFGGCGSKKDADDSTDSVDSAVDSTDSADSAVDSTKPEATPGEIDKSGPLDNMGFKEDKYAPYTYLEDALAAVQEGALKKDIDSDLSSWKEVATNGLTYRIPDGWMDFSKEAYDKDSTLTSANYLTTAGLMSIISGKVKIDDPEKYLGEFIAKTKNDPTLKDPVILNTVKTDHGCEIEAIISELDAEKKVKYSEIFCVATKSEVAVLKYGPLAGEDKTAADPVDEYDYSQGVCVYGYLRLQVYANETGVDLDYKRISKIIEDHPAVHKGDAAKKAEEERKKAEEEAKKKAEEEEKEKAEADKKDSASESKDSTSKDSTSKDSTSKDSTDKKDSASKDTTSKDTTSKDSTDKKDTATVPVKKNGYEAADWKTITTESGLQFDIPACWSVYKEQTGTINIYTPEGEVMIDETFYRDAKSYKDSLPYGAVGSNSDLVSEIRDTLRRMKNMDKVITINADGTTDIGYEISFRYYDGEAGKNDSGWYDDCQIIMSDAKIEVQYWSETGDANGSSADFKAFEQVREKVKAGIRNIM